MRENGLKALQKRRFKKTSDSEHGGPIAPNVLDQDFIAEQPNEKWGADISYIWTAEGWLYLAIVVDLFSRRIVGWATSDRMKKDLALTALKRALVLRQPPQGVIHHSDRGSQYCSDDYQKDRGVVPSMSGKGNCDDNAMVETVFKTIKSEMIWRTAWQSRNQGRVGPGAARRIGLVECRSGMPFRRHSMPGETCPMNGSTSFGGKAYPSGVDRLPGRVSFGEADRLIGVEVGGSVHGFIYGQKLDRAAAEPFLA
ncbi:Integrase core domain protein [Magnetospirillum gryphiswaldense MSR-1]|uniref:Transposase orfB, IS3 family element n=1 Tax=Magnetospirillum gryphiswaldense TaxID=55518 RepID=A4U5D3_9PROT|nr:Integrase core domain protein [Magnetospirillum gryphiswaldense MSR-1]AVM76811.1 Integrase core domain protein [Magnetospirillum gryphiswaldense]CAM78090.1 transposase orfB, IS3 family element [Magnetospirillum gryphiswaldense MSR-1]